MLAFLFPDIDLVWMALFDFIVFAVLQMLVCTFVKNKWIRLLPVVGLIIAGIVCFVRLYFAEGWDSLGYLGWMLMCAFWAFSCCVGWIIWIIIRQIRKNK